MNDLHSYTFYFLLQTLTIMISCQNRNNETLKMQGFCWSSFAKLEEN